MLVDEIFAPHLERAGAHDAVARGHGSRCGAGDPARARRARGTWTKPATGSSSSFEILSPGRSPALYK